MTKYPTVEMITILASDKEDKNFEVWIKTPAPSTMEVDKKFSTKEEAEQHLAELKSANPDWKVWIDTTSNRARLSEKFPEAGETDDSGYTEAAKETVAGGFSFCKKCAQMSQTMPDGTCQLCRKEK